MYKLDPPSLLFEIQPSRAAPRRSCPASDVPDRPLDALIPAEHLAPIGPAACPSWASSTSSGTTRTSRR